MTDWGAGYVTDITYKPGYYPQQSPWHLTLCGSLCGVQMNMPGADDPLHYLELGAGIGFGALQIAASNPAWRVTAIDFNPAHVAIARRLAAEAGIANARFLEADLATLAEDPAVAEVPMADVVSLHGVWSWVAPAVQAGIVRLLKARVNPGGLVHLSYNALPAWQGAMGLQRLIRQTGLRQAGRSDRQAEAGLQFAQALFEAGARNLAPSPTAQRILKTLGQGAPEYLAHELMNGAWVPCFHADVAEALSGARLDYVGSASIIENFPELTLDETQRVLQARYDDPMMRELIKDICIDRPLRSDIFVRGAVRVPAAARERALSEMTLGLVTPPEKFSYTFTAPVGEVTMNQAFYGAIVRTLADGPCRLARLVSLPDPENRPRTASELIGMLAGSGQGELVARPGADAGAAARRLNALAARRFVDASRLTGNLAAASVRMGSGLACSGLELFVLDRLAAVGGWIDPAAWVAELGPDLPPEQAAKLREFILMLKETRSGAWQLAGLV